MKKLLKLNGGSMTNGSGKPQDHHHKYHGHGSGGQRRNSGGVAISTTKMLLSSLSLRAGSVA